LTDLVQITCIELLMLIDLEQMCCI